MRISDWSSDVCSSDLLARPSGDPARHRIGPEVRWLPEALSGRPRRQFRGRIRRPPPAADAEGRGSNARRRHAGTALHAAAATLHRGEPGQEDGGTRQRTAIEDRKNTVWGKGVAGRVDHGGRRIMKKKHRIRKQETTM